MNRKDFSKILDSIIIPEGCSTDFLNASVRPLSSAILQMMPERLFRYRCCSDRNIEAFEKDKIYAVTANNFNDPYDTLVRYDIEKMKEIFRNVLTKDNLQKMREELEHGGDIPESVKHYFPTDFIEQAKLNIFKISNNSYLENALMGKIENFMEQMSIYYQLVAEMNKRYTTISCFSETIHSVTMWSHYADYHKGFALEYNLKSMLSKGIPNVGVFPVIYDEERYDATSYTTWMYIKLLGINIPNPDMFSHIKYALHKSKQWKYEQEWRLIDCSTRGNIIQDEFTVIKLKPIAIYYGQNITKENKDLLHQIALQKEIKEYNMYIDVSSPKYEMLF